MYRRKEEAEGSSVWQGSRQRGVAFGHCELLAECGTDWGTIQQKLTTGEIYFASLKRMEDISECTTRNVRFAIGKDVEVLPESTSRDVDLAEWVCRKCSY